MDEHSEPQVRVVDRRWWAQADAAQSTPTAEPEPVKGPKPTYIEQLEQRVADMSAEFDQARARMRRDMEREVGRNTRAVLAELLDVLDNLDRAIAAAGEDESPLLVGVRLVRDQFLSKLEGFGVVRLEALGEPFDAMQHEAIATSPVDDPELDGRVVAVVAEGYAIGDELLRPASVVVGARA
ncbi:MAG TPA: nucleotide exchange factor GrpE [Vicinamibacterales bacterium]|nr:nucleotide exchange factor GrpE [Vicinamibacterales bacterium]